MQDPDAPLRVFAAERILALDGTQPQAFATRGDRVVATGSREELAAKYTHAEWTELQGSLVVPAFNDAHCHPSQAAFARLRVSLRDATSQGAFRAALAHSVSATPAGAWVIAQEFDDSKIDGQVDRKFLDSVSRAHPVLVVHYTLHRAVLNSLALERLGYGSARDAPYGGELLTDVHGELNGWILERAWLDRWMPGIGQESVVPDLALALKVAALNDVMGELNAVGITSFCDAIVTPAEHEAYVAAFRRGTPTARVSMLIWHSYFSEQAEPALASDRLQVSGVKMMLDGALSGGTCLCREPYASEADDDHGLQILDDSELHSEILRVHSAGMRAAVHANGDSAIDKVLNTVEQLRQRLDGPPMNHRIEHCSIVDGGLVRRLKRANVTAVPFGAFVHLYGEKIRGYYGEERLSMTSAHRSLLDGGVVVAGSSDYPLAPVNPLLGIQSMVTRDTVEGRAAGHNQRISVLEALRVYTSGSAHASGDSPTKGKLAPGFLADFIVLDDDITRMNANDIAEASVVSTWIGSERVWGTS